MAFIYDLTDTWNAGGTTFNAIKMNVTDTASAAASKLITVQVSGSEKFSVKKDGVGYFAGNVGIGTNSPSALLEIAANNNGSENNTFRITDTDTFVASGDTLGKIEFYATDGAAIKSFVKAEYSSSQGDAELVFGTSGSASAATERLRITSAGSVGIGTSSPTNKLDVTGVIRSVSATFGNSDVIAETTASTGTGYSRFILKTTDREWRLINDASTSGSPFLLYDATAAATRLLVNSSGNVGIGTSSPTNLLHVSATGLSTPALVQSTSTVARIAFRDAGTTDSNTVRLGSAGDAMSFLAGGSERMRIDSSGRVGIGTTSPQTRLDVKTYYSFGNAANGAIRAEDWSDASRGGYFEEISGLRIFDSSSYYGAEARLPEKTTSSGMKLDLGTIKFFTDASLTVGTNYTPTERMVITSSGSVGIGTSSPASYGHSLVVAKDASGGATYATITNTNANQFLNLGINADVAEITWDDNDSLAFGTTAISTNEGQTLEVMRLTSTGNVGIGTTPSAKLEVRESSTSKSWSPTPGITTLLVERSGGAGLTLAGATGTSKLNFASASDENAGFISYVLADNAMTFRTNGSGEDMRIDSSGRLLVGTTTVPDGSTNGQSFSGAEFRSSRDTTSAVQHVRFYNLNGQVGNINTNGSATNYVTSSDARLKHDIVDAPEASDLIDAIKVRRFKWNADDSEQRYGMIAQELVEVAPEAVSVPQDEDEMMGVDYSKLVPMLVKEIQSLRARVAQLEGQ